MLERRIRVINQLGLHARAAAKLVKLSAGFSSTITVRNGERVADARSILDLLGIGAAFDRHVDIVVDGPDEEAAMASVTELFKCGFGEL